MKIISINVTSNETLAIQISLDDKDVSMIGGSIQKGVYWVEAFYNVIYKDFSNYCLDSLDNWDTSDFSKFVSEFVNNIDIWMTGSEISVGVFRDYLQASPLYELYLRDWDMTHAEGAPVCYDEWFYNEFTEYMYDNFEANYSNELIFSFYKSLIYNSFTEIRLSEDEFNIFLDRLCGAMGEAII